MPNPSDEHDAPTSSRSIFRRRTRPVRGSAFSAAGTRERVLLSARKVLIREGHARFSIRRVADLAGIAVGNLTYHFPSKRQLLRVLIESLIAEYRTGIERFYQDLPSGSEGSLVKLVGWLMHDAASLNSSRIFRELWTMALHDRVVARAIDDFYDVSINKVVALLRKSYPSLEARDALELVHLLALMSEGTNVIYGTRLDRAVPLDRLTQVASATLAELLRTRIAVPPAPRSAARKSSR
jgi:AcrR family transcriptional regulator